MLSPKKTVPVHSTGKSPEPEHGKVSVHTTHKSTEKKIITVTTTITKKEGETTHDSTTASKKIGVEHPSGEHSTQSHGVDSKILGSPSTHLKTMSGAHKAHVDEVKKSTIVKGTEGAEAKTGSNKFLASRKSSSPVVDLEAHTFKDPAEKTKAPVPTSSKPIPHYMLPTKKTQPEAETSDITTARTSKGSQVHKEGNHKTVAAAKSPPREVQHGVTHHAAHQTGPLPAKPPVPSVKELLHKEAASHHIQTASTHKDTTITTTTTVHMENPTGGVLNSSRTNTQQHPQESSALTKVPSHRATAVVSPPRRPCTPEKQDPKSFGATHKVPDKVKGVKAEKPDKIEKPEKPEKPAVAPPGKHDQKPVEFKDKNTPVKVPVKTFHTPQKATSADHTSSSTTHEEVVAATDSAADPPINFEELAADDPRLRGNLQPDEVSAAVPLPSFKGFQKIEVSDDIFSGDESANPLNKLTGSFNILFKKYYGIEVFDTVEGQAACEAAREKVYRSSKSRPRFMTTVTLSELNTMRTSTLSRSPTRKPVQLKPAVVIPQDKLSKGPSSNPLGSLIESNNTIPQLKPTSQFVHQSSVLTTSAPKDRIDQNFPKPYNLCDKPDSNTQPIIPPPETVAAEAKPKAERTVSGRMNTADMKDLIHELNLESIETLLQEQQEKEEEAMKALEAKQSEGTSSKTDKLASDGTPLFTEEKRETTQVVVIAEETEDDFDLDREYRKIVQGEHTPSPKCQSASKKLADDLPDLPAAKTLNVPTETRSNPEEPQIKQEDKQTKSENLGTKTVEVTPEPPKQPVVVSHLYLPPDSMKKPAPKPTPRMVALAGELHKETHVRLNDSFGETFESPTNNSERPKAESPLLEGLTPMVRELGHEAVEKADIVEENKNQKTLEEKGGFTMKINLVAPCSPDQKESKGPVNEQGEKLKIEPAKSIEQINKKIEVPVVTEKVQGVTSPEIDSDSPEPLVVESHSHKVVAPLSHPVIQTSTVDTLLPQVPVNKDNNTSKISSGSTKKLHKVGSQEKLVEDIRHHLIEGEKNQIRGIADTGLVGVHTGSLIFGSNSVIGDHISQTGPEIIDPIEEKNSKESVDGESNAESMKLDPTLKAKIENHEMLTPHAAANRMGISEKNIPHIDPNLSFKQQPQTTIVKQSLVEKKPDVIPSVADSENSHKHKHLVLQPSHSMTNINPDEVPQTPAPLTPRRLAHDKDLVPQNIVQPEQGQNLEDENERSENLSPLSGSACLLPNQPKTNIAVTPRGEIHYIPRTEEDLPPVNLPGIGPTDKLEEDFTLDQLNPDLMDAISKKMVDILFGSEMGSIGPVFELSSQSNFAKGAKDAHPVLNQLSQKGVQPNDFVPIDSAGGRVLLHGQSKYGGVEEDLPPIAEERTGDDHLPTLAEIINNDANLQYMEEKSRTLDSSRYRGSNSTPKVAMMNILGLSPKNAPPLEIKKKLEDPVEQKSIIQNIMNNPESAKMINEVISLQKNSVSIKSNLKNPSQTPQLYHDPNKIRKLELERVRKTGYGKGEADYQKDENDLFLLEIRPIDPHSYPRTQNSLTREPTSRGGRENGRHAHPSTPHLRRHAEEDPKADYPRLKRFNSSHNLQLDDGLESLLTIFENNYNKLIRNLVNEKKIELRIARTKIETLERETRLEVGRAVEAKGIGKIRDEIVNSDCLRQWVKILKVIREVSLSCLRAERAIPDATGCVTGQELAAMFHRVNRIVEKEMKLLAFDREEVYDQIVHIINIDMSSPEIKKKLRAPKKTLGKWRPGPFAKMVKTTSKGNNEV